MALVAKWAGRLLFAIALAAALAVHRRIPWIPPAYLGALIVLPVAARWISRRRRLPPHWRWSAVALALAGFLALWPVPWMKVQADDPPGTAWRLDGRLVIDGEIVDPPGRWYWLTAGRPPIIAEVFRSWLHLGPDIEDLHDGKPSRRPAVVEPAAAAVGLRLAGRPPADGHVDAAIGGPFARTLPVTWYRNLSLGTSHGLMVALVSYASESGVDLAAGRSIAGTGGINEDGTVRPIGDLPAKARAARQIGADILLFPASQRGELAGFESESMQLVPVATLYEAVAALTGSSP
jgi:hypothetical protein